MVCGHHNIRVQITPLDPNARLSFSNGALTVSGKQRHEEWCRDCGEKLIDDYRMSRQAAIERAVRKFPEVIERVAHLDEQYSKSPFWQQSAFHPSESFIGQQTFDNSGPMDQIRAEFRRIMEKK